MKNVRIIDIRLIPLNKTKKCEYSFKALYFSGKEIWLYIILIIFKSNIIKQNKLESTVKYPKNLNVFGKSSMSICKYKENDAIPKTNNLKIREKLKEFIKAYLFFISVITSAKIIYKMGLQNNLHKNSVGKMKNNNHENKAKTKQKIKFLEVNWQIKFSVLVKVGKICD